MAKQRRIELLAPAKNVECGMEAIAHGADAVYIGAPKFGARAAAGNSVDDIAALVHYAHTFGARIYVTMNTLLRDDELREAVDMAWTLYRVGVDALIVQDMALMQMAMPPIPLHASTQMDNRTPEKVEFLARAGFSQVVLARELSLKEIAAIHARCDVPLEAFVHGALCVSYSGQCYASQACFGRSANRGECAQFCRLPFTLEDAEGRVIERNRHLLSLKDMNRVASLEEMMDAGVTSFKIEGRLKEVTYVKNVTASYRKAIDAILARRPEYVRSSVGRSTYTFEPQLDKSFNRGFTEYFLHGRGEDITSFASPKSKGEPVGHVKEVNRRYIAVSSAKAFHNGDGLCYMDDSGELRGFRVNRVEGNRLFPQVMPDVRPRTPLFRNYDQEFEKVLSRPSAQRRIAADIRLYEVPFGFALRLTDEIGRQVSLTFPREKELARSEQKGNMVNQLSKVGSSVLQAREVTIDLSENWFLPSSVLADMRRQLVEAYERMLHTTYPQEVRHIKVTAHPFVTSQLTYLGNVGNAQARAFYQAHGVQKIAPALELCDVPDAVLMFCKHCLRYSMGWCPHRQGGHSPYKEPYTLVSADGSRYRLSFDCRACMMKVSRE